MKSTKIPLLALCSILLATPLYAQQSIPERAQMTPLQTAIFAEKPAEVSRLLSSGANPGERDADGKTALHHAAQMEDPQYLRLLLNAGADPNMASSSGDNALFDAIESLHADNVRILLDAGANPNQADIVDKTPLHVAAAMNQSDIMLMLLERGADPQARNKAGFTFQKYLHPDSYVPLNAKGKEGRQQVVNWLQKHGVPVDSELLK